MNSYQSYCLEGCHCRQTVIKSIFEKLNPKTMTLVKVIKGTCSICGRNKSQIFTK